MCCQLPCSACPGLRHPQKWLWALFAALLAPLGPSLYRLLTVQPEQVQALVTLFSQWEASNNAAYGMGSFLAAAGEHTREMLFVHTDSRNFRTLASFNVQLFTTMVLGPYWGGATFSRTRHRTSISSNASSGRRSPSASPQVPFSATTTPP
jgi:hypothetical protein